MRISHWHEIWRLAVEPRSRQCRGLGFQWAPNAHAGCEHGYLRVKAKGRTRIPPQSDIKKNGTGNSLSEVLNDLCLHVEKIVPSSVCSVMLLDKETGVLNIAAAPSSIPISL